MQWDDKDGPIADEIEPDVLKFPPADGTNAALKNEEDSARPPCSLTPCSLNNRLPQACVDAEGVQMTAVVQVFGRRDDETDRALKRPATKKRQGTKSRAVGHWLAASAMGIACRGCSRW
jgi:hypothetical protein